MTNDGFAWIAFYTEFADKLLVYRDDRTELIRKIRQVFSDIGLKLPKLEKDGNPTDIDPFTVFGLFNKGISEQNRLVIVGGFAREFSVEASVPDRFVGVPVLNNLKATFYWFADGRGEHDIDNLWEVYDAALVLSGDDTTANRERFIAAYDMVSTQKGIKWNITMGLYWVRPYYFINLDSKNRWYMQEPNVMPEDFVRDVTPLLKSVPSAEEYLQIRDQCSEVIDSGRSTFHNFPELSYHAWKVADEVNQELAKDDWRPTDYESGISESDWETLLADPQIFTAGSLEIMKRMKDYGGEATCNQLSAKYGESSSFYSTGSSSIARRIAEKTGCPIYLKGDEASRYWPILYLGRDAGKSGKGSFVWKLRDELSAALDKADLGNVPLYAGTALGDAEVDTVHYWLYAPGESAGMWSSFYQEGIMALGWDELGNLNDYADKEEMRLKLQEVFGGDSSYKNSAHALWQFAHEMKPGDVVFAKRGRSELLGKGIVESDYEYDEDAGEYPHIRKIHWTHNGSWQAGETLAMKTLTDLSNYTNTVEKFLALFKEEEAEEDEEQEEKAACYPPYTEEDFLKEVYIGVKEYRTLVGLLKNKKNIILQGAPGVGKTFIAKRLAYSIMGVRDMDRVMMVQFHQSYSYEDFIMGFRPSKDGFELKKGAFYNFCKRAEVDSEKDYFFIIDEIIRPAREDRHLFLAEIAGNSEEADGLHL